MWCGARDRTFRGSRPDCSIPRLPKPELCHGMSPSFCSVRGNGCRDFLGAGSCGAQIAGRSGIGDSRMCLASKAEERGQVERAESEEHLLTEVEFQGPHDNVCFQGVIWESQEGAHNGNIWWQVLKGQVEELLDVGIADIWLPPRWLEKLVTFLHNHDPRSTQVHAAFPDEKGMQGYEYILTHVGLSCIFYDRLYQFQLLDEIKKLVEWQVHHHISTVSRVNIRKAEGDTDFAKIDKLVFPKLGSRGEWGHVHKKLKVARVPGVTPRNGKSRQEIRVAVVPQRTKNGGEIDERQPQPPGLSIPKGKAHTLTTASLEDGKVVKKEGPQPKMAISEVDVLKSNAQIEPDIPAASQAATPLVPLCESRKSPKDEQHCKDIHPKTEVHGRKTRPGRPTPHGPYDNILIQAFNWESHNKSIYSPSWWVFLKTKIKDFVALGITDIWLPPPSHSVDKNGYLPSELYNLDASNYGTAGELKELIDELHLHGMSVIGDIVINHRCGGLQDCRGRWNVFKGGNQDKRLDWGDWAVVDDDLYDGGGKGTHDTGEVYAAAPDLDHTNKQVQDELTDWMNWLKAEIGFDGWRFDFVKGYDPKFTSMYCTRTNPTLSVGELWTSMSYNGGQLCMDQSKPSTAIIFGLSNLECAPDKHRQTLCNWIDGTKGSSWVFDFTTKGILQHAVKNELWRLKDSKGRPPGLIGWYPQNAVTFIDNHDTGSTQRHWVFPDDKVEMGYAYILTHPGIPCIFMDHVYEYKLKEQIEMLLKIRKYNRINAMSRPVIQKAEATIYVVKIDNRLILKLGSRVDMDDLLPDKDKWKIVMTGAEYCIWESTEPLLPEEHECAVKYEDDFASFSKPTQPIRITEKMSEETRKRILEEVPELVRPEEVIVKPTHTEVEEKKEFE